ncbi:MAG: transcription antitermination factor NusB [Thermodesulfobacteriota bacterium]
MKNRRKSRELALQALFCIDMLEEETEPLIEEICRLIDPPEKARPYFLTLVNGVVEHRQDIDERIVGTSSNWKLSRMSFVDRNIIRLSVYELLFRDDIPPKVAINEAIDVGKKFGTEKSGGFINGILDSVYQRFIGDGAPVADMADMSAPGGAEKKQ